jgi:hypothetical protein
MDTDAISGKSKGKTESCIYLSDNVPLQLQMSDYWSKFLCTYGSERKKNKSIVFAAHTMNYKCLTFTNKYSTPCHMF